MLTIQPKFSDYSTHKIAFKAQTVAINADETGDEYFQKKVDYYKNQAREFENLAQNSESKGFKTVMKVFRVVSEALLEGWAVAWGASKGAKILKTSAISGANSKFMSHVKNVFKPIGDGIKGSKDKIAEYISKFKETKFATKTTEKFNKFIDKINENKIGKFVVNGFKYVGRAIKYVGSLIKAGFEHLIKPFKGKSASEIYDKAAQATSTTLGVGAGAAGAYNSATDNKGRVDANPKNEVVDPQEEISDLEDEV